MEPYERLRSEYQDFLKIPFENISNYLNQGPQSLENLAENIPNNLGGDCSLLSKHMRHRLRRAGIESKIVYFENNLHKNNACSGNIEDMCHVALVAKIGNSSYLLDPSFQIEVPIPLENNSQINTPTKRITVKKEGCRYVLRGFSNNPGTPNLCFNPNLKWNEEDARKHAANTYAKLSVLKYAILRGGKKLGFKQVNDRGIIVLKDKDTSKFIIESGMRECADYLNINPWLFERAYEIRSKLINP